MLKTHDYNIPMSDSDDDYDDDNEVEDQYSPAPNGSNKRRKLTDGERVKRLSFYILITSLYLNGLYLFLYILDEREIVSTPETLAKGKKPS